MSESDYDRRVKDILDRVAKGHLSSDEGATLIAALTPPSTPTPPAGPVADATSGSGAGGTSPAAGTGGPSAEAGAGGPSGAGAGGSAGGTSAGGPSTAWPTADDVPSPSVWAEAVDSPDAADTATGPKPEAAPSTQGSVVDEAPGDQKPVEKAVEEPVGGAPEDAEPTEEEREAEHSNVPMPSGVQRVTIRAVGRRVRLIGEPAINGVAVDGPHVIKRDGDTLSINSEGDMGVSIDGFSMLRTRSVGDLKSHVNGFAKELWIRVNPMLGVEVEVTGGSVTAERLPGLTRVRVTAGTAKVTDVDGPIDLLVQAGSAHLDAQLTKGRSRVRVESGAATVNLRRGSDVRVHTEAQLGRVTWTGAVNGQSKDVEIGRGRAALDVEVLVGTAQITSD